MQISQAQKSKGNNHSVLRRRRRKPYPTPPGQIPDAELIASHIAEKGITQCSPGWAMGALKSSALGLDT